MKRGKKRFGKLSSRHNLFIGAMFGFMFCAMNLETLKRTETGNPWMILGFTMISAVAVFSAYEAGKEKRGKDV